jgi:hypothetical protein
MQSKILLVTAALLLSMVTTSTPLNAQMSESELSATGKWKGTRTVTGQTGGPEEFKVHSISFDLKQTEQSISGSYKCYAGNHANTDCNNPVGRVISGTVKDHKIMLKVQAMPNILNCTFDGVLEATTMKGRYTCYVGGSLGTTGIWEVHRY